MAVLYEGKCKECKEIKQLCAVDPIGMEGWQDTSMNSICSDCSKKIDRVKDAEIDRMSIEERLTTIERMLKIRPEIG